MTRIRKQEPVHIVFLGGGYTSIWAYRSLHKRLKAQIHQRQVILTIITPESYHLFHGWTGEIVSGILATAHQKSSLSEICQDARIVSGTAINLDLAQQIVSVQLTASEQQMPIRYDHLIFGCGSFDNLESIPGLADNGWSLKNICGPEKLHDHLLALVEQSEAFLPKVMDDSSLSVVIAGGGFAGVEVCAAIAELFNVLQRHYPTLKTCPPRLLLIHSGASLLPQLQPRFARLVTYATKQLNRYGVVVRTGVRLKHVTSSGVELSDGTFIPASTVISTVGQRVHPIPGSESLPHTEDGRLCTDEYLRVNTTQNLWAGGDISYVIHPIKGKPCPDNALWAIKHGEWIGNNIALTLQGKPLRRFSYPGLGQAASLGIGKGMLELYGFLFTGWIAWLLRLGFFLYFMPLRKFALRTLLDMLLLPITGRHLTPTGEKGFSARSFVPGQSYNSSMASLKLKKQ